MPCKTNTGNNIAGRPPEHQLWMLDDVAKHLRCSRDAIYRLVARQEIPHIRLFKRRGLRFRKREIEEWLSSQCRPDTKES